MKANGEIVKFLKQKDYLMVNNDLGSGSFGQTVLLQDPFIDELFVAKKYEPYYEDDRKEFYDSFLQEIKIMYKLNHRNVVRIYNYYAYEDQFTGYILMEYIDGVPLLEYLETAFSWDENGVPDKLFTQLIDGFQYIESQGIVHRDIREGNIMVDRNGVVKIIDFGLGKTFKPVETTEDSMNEIINRSGLDLLPNEYFEGTYDSQTDMFYLAELFNRLLRQSNMADHFSYQSILNKMMAQSKSDRYNSFADVQSAIRAKDFSTLEISKEDKKIYQAFANAIYQCLAKFKQKSEFNYSVDEFYKRLQALIKTNCFEDIIQDNSSLVGTVVSNGFVFYSQKTISCDVVIQFRDWFSNLVPDSQNLVLNNIIAKISTIETEEPEPELPF